MVLNIFSVVAFAEGDLADYSSLTDYIEKYVPIDNNAGIYSSESYAPVAAVLDAIDYDLPAAQQSTVDGYLSELQSAVADLVADESQAVAQFSLTGTSDPLHPGDTVTVTFGLTTNYGVISAGAVIIFDSTMFELVGGTTINDTVVNHATGVLSAYNMTGSVTNTAKIFAQRNSNTSYWNTNEMKAQYTALNVGFALNSKVSDPVVANGTVATMTFRVLNDAQFGTQGGIFMSSDFNKTSSFAGGLNYAARSVGQKMGPTSTCIATGQTLNLSAAQLTLSVNHTVEIDAAVAATCTTTGLTEGSHCSVCDAVLTAQETVAALGHNYEAVVTNPTCTEGGYTTYTCSRCGDTYTGDETEATGHNYEAVVTNPTCTEGGYTTYTCSGCGDSYVADETEALGHTPAAEWTVVTPATCSAEGLKAIYCTICGEIIESETIATTDHAWDDGEITTPPSCTETGVKTYTCTVCGATTTETVEATGHNYEAVVTNPTCTEGGYTTYTCSGCGDSYVADETEALGHSWDEGTVTTPATCTQTGVMTYTCSTCGETYTDDIATVAHTPGDAAVENIDGVDKSVVRCTVCGEIISATDLGLADYTELNAAIAAAEAIDPVTVYNTTTYATLMDYIETVDLTLSSAHQDQVDAYTSTINGYMNGLTVASQIRLVGGTASIEGTTITLTPAQDQTQITMYPTLVCGDRVTFSNNDGPSISKSGSCYSKVNGTVMITLADERQFTVVFAMKDPALDVADYTAVNAALAKAAAIKGDDVYDDATYTALMTAVNAVETGLHEKDQKRVDAFATAINNALKNIVIIQDTIQRSGNAIVTKDGDTITFTMSPTSTQNYMTVYKRMINGDPITYLRTGKLIPVSDNIRFSVKQNTSAKIRLANGKEFNVLFVVTPLEATGLDALETVVAKANNLVADDYYDFSGVTAVLNDIDKDLDEEDDANLINYYIMAVNDEIDALQTIVSLLKLQNAYASKDGDTITVKIIPGNTLVSIYKTLTNNEPIEIFDVEGLQLYKTGTKYYTKVGGTSKITISGDRTYNVIYSTEFVKEFRPEFVTLRLVDGAYSYDAEKQIFTTSTSSTIARVYKDARSSNLSINTGDYSFITETSQYYQINSANLPYSARGVASFVVNADDGTDVTFIIRFTNIATRSVIKVIPFTNATDLSLDGDVITVTLDRNVIAKTFVTIPKTVEGETVTVTSDSAYVQSQTNQYVLRYQAAGADISLNFDGNDYVINFVVVNPTT